MDLSTLKAELEKERERNRRLVGRIGRIGLIEASVGRLGVDPKEWHRAVLKPVRSMLRAGSNRNGARKLFRPCYEPAKPFAHKKGQYLAFIYYYGKLNGQPHAEADMQRKFGVSPPSVHQMILTLETKGFIERIPGK
jgi:hypothetical protein